ncbi:MAG: PTS sugar transporter subunit IIB, partial [Prevotella sp.]
KHEAWYDLTLTYTGSDGKKLVETYKYDCETSRTSHDIDIPASVGNFRSLDAKVVATDALKAVENDEYFYKRTKSYDNKSYLPTVPVPSGLGTEYQQFDSKVDLVWTAFTSYGGTYKYYSDSKPYVYRIETDSDGTPMSGQSWSRRGKLKAIGSNTAMSYTDNDKQDLKPNRFYKYMVVNVPAAWETSLSGQLNNPDDALLQMLGHCESAVMSTKPLMDIYNLHQDLSETTKVVLHWQYSRVPVSSTDVSFDVWRSPYGTAQWTNIGNTKGKANPEAGFMPTFEDKNLENSVVRYDYKVTLTFNEGVNTEESNVVTGSLLSSSSINQFTATKGTHEGTVRLQWDVKQVGTGNTNYDVYRRYVDGTEDDWMRIYTTVGTSESYTFEDNTVQPGYYYQYRVDCYGGTKADGTTEISTKSDVGFCQARGVVSGRVTFANGNTSVADVRVTLRPAEEGTDNAVQSYAQRVSGASTGIAWNATQDELAKVFGTDKNFTVQMFVRPDTLLSEGAIIGEIPGEGQPILGNNNNGNYAGQRVYVCGRFISDIYQLFKAGVKLPRVNLGNVTQNTGEVTVLDNTVRVNAEEKRMLKEMSDAGVPIVAQFRNDNTPKDLRSLL